MDIFQQYIAKSRYARFLPKEKRREHFDETVKRYIDFISEKIDELESDLKNDIFNAINNLEVMPSMRALMTAGKALERDNTSSFNCAYLPIDDVKSFDEAMLILMNGTGVGFSVERQYINQLPEVPDKLYDSETTIVVKDSKEGWAKSLRILLALLYSGEIPKWDVSKVRPAGATLKTFGGRASGAGPLVDLFNFIIKIFQNAKGRKLTSLECHDIMCKIGEIVVTGAVRRSALISLSNLSDDRMRHAKDGQWWVANPQRALSNNSAVYNEKPDVGSFMKEWLSIYESKSGERGIFSRDAAKRIVERNGRRDLNYAHGTNPCAEIILRPYGFCNLSEAVVRANDTLEDLEKKVRIASIIGTIQSTFTHFPYLRKMWQKNAEEERLLGVSLTGIYDNCLLNNYKDVNLCSRLENLKEIVINTNKEWAERLGINQSAATSCVKPSGCRTKDSLITTNQGILRLDEFEYNSKWLSLNDNYNGEYGKITKTYNNGIEDVYELELNFGIKLRSTSNHQWMINKRGWLRTDEIGIDDQIVVNMNSYKNETNVKLFEPKQKLYHNCNTNITLPIELTPDFGWLLGYILGDGAMCKDKGRFRFVDGHLPSIEKNKNIFNNLFSMNKKITKLTDRNAFSIEYGSKKLWAYFEENNILKDHDKIPLPVRKSSKETIIAFLAGLLDSDGHVKNHVVWTTANKELAEHFQHVCWAVGLIVGRSENSQRKNSFSKKPIYLLNLSWGQSAVESRELLKKHSVKFKNWIEPISNNKSKAYKIGLVKKITKIGKFPTFDVETEQHWFWAGAFMSHNTVSSLVDCASGIHPRYSKYYIRRARSDNKDPLTKFLIQSNIPNEPDIMKPEYTTVFSFPMKAPEGAITKEDISPIDHLELWSIYQKHWCEHKPSVTISVKEEEWPRVGAWVYDHFDELSGVSFLPFDGGSYRQAPYEAINREQYEKMVQGMPKKINWDQFVEQDDMVEGTQTLACVAGGCDV
jgi:ribonucleoside-triphosphate reductase (thioredoxin)